jgi:hypothetical protein
MLMINDQALAERFGPASEIRLPISQLVAIVATVAGAGAGARRSAGPQRTAP